MYVNKRDTFGIFWAKIMNTGPYLLKLKINRGPVFGDTVYTVNHNY